jgi:antitoxin component YwqK of YwqJK toxin-antitoxin module
MNKVFGILLVGFLMPGVSFPVWGVHYNDLYYRDGLFYKKFTSTPFTGKVDEGYQLGSIVDGKQDGTWEAYYESGELQAKWNHKNGKKHGTEVFYHRNGQLGIKGVWENGKKEGHWEYYNMDGTIKQKLTGTYKNDVKVSN